MERMASGRLPHQPVWLTPEPFHYHQLRIRYLPEWPAVKPPAEEDFEKRLMASPALPLLERLNRPHTALGLLRRPSLASSIGPGEAHAGAESALDRESPTVYIPSPPFLSQNQNAR